ncbi:LytR/AlgR family response regulator transcription factor [Ekhidna sp. To15]|uniref:LytR/AlgR family response regulator transcription factor n=1 Tax=Ekhidna sp. To15 TaxID=3395267 RepID=UPI003F51DD91
MNKKLSIGLLAFILFLIVFDAVQQKYYIETFGLVPENETLSLGFLLKKHFVRWLAWGLFSVPSGILIWKKLPKNHQHLTIKTILAITVIIFVNTVASLALISGYEIIDQQLSYSNELFLEFITFFTFQKGLTFLMASTTLTMLLYNRSREKTIESQFVEITNLRTKSTDLEEALNVTSNQEPHLSIKTGNKFQPIPLSDIVWIQSDDYCVKIHTEDNAFTLRKSMKSLEEKLAPYSFIRVHRVALLNLNYLHQINFDRATIKLSNTTELPLSRTGAKALKRKLSQSSL